MNAYAVISTKLTTGQQLVFSVVDDERDATLIAERLRSFGLQACIRSVHPGAVSAGMPWAPRDHS
jgi:hypothetical protein